MIDLEKLDEYTRKRVESDVAEMRRRKTTTEKFLEGIFLAKICRTDDFLRNPIIYDELEKYTEATGGRTKSTRRQLAVIKLIKEEQCHE